MTTQELERINVLAAKSRTQPGLTDEEKEEQASLRQKYIAEMKASLRGQLDSIDVQNPDGSVTSLAKKPAAKAAGAKKKSKVKPS